MADIIYGETIPPSDFNIYDDEPQLPPLATSTHTSRTTLSRTSCTNSAHTSRTNFIITRDSEVYYAKPFKIFIDAHDADTSLPLRQTDESEICYEASGIRRRGKSVDRMREDFLQEHDKKTVLERRKKEYGMAYRFPEMGGKETPGVEADEDDAEQARRDCDAEEAEEQMGRMLRGGFRED